MSMDVTKPVESKTPFQIFKEGVKTTAPKQFAVGRVVDRGLVYFNHGQPPGRIWETNVDDLDRFQMMLNEKGIRQIHRQYKFEVVGGQPCKTLEVNVIATRAAWPTENVRLKLGDEVNLYAWKEGEYVQFGFRKE
jgi:hypothetical protein